MFIIMYCLCYCKLILVIRIYYLQCSLLSSLLVVSCYLFISIRATRFSIIIVISWLIYLMICISIHNDNYYYVLFIKLLLLLCSALLIIIKQYYYLHSCNLFCVKVINNIIYHYAFAVITNYILIVAVINIRIQLPIIIIIIYF